MSDSRLTVRFTDDEMAKIKSQADALDMSRADVVRMAVHSLFGADRQATRTAEMLDGFGDQIRAELALKLTAQAVQNRRVALLLLKVMNAPREAEEALLKIFES